MRTVHVYVSSAIRLSEVIRLSSCSDAHFQLHPQHRRWPAALLSPSADPSVMGELRTQRIRLHDQRRFEPGQVAWLEPDVVREGVHVRRDGMHGVEMAEVL